MTVNEVDLTGPRGASPIACTSSAYSTSTSPEDYGYQKIVGAPAPAPIQKPPFTLKEIRDAIPDHCFHPSLLKSLAYLMADLIFCVGVFYLSTYIPLLSKTGRIFIWPLYWFLQGTSMTGLWVLGHECGHHAFSPYKWINSTVGFIIHSSLLVPYFNWRESHRRHHVNTSSIENDATHIPPTRSSVQSTLIDLIKDWPLYNLTCILFMCTIAWFPMYLVYNITGPVKHHGKKVNHFSPSADIFLPKQWKEVILGDLGFLAAVSCLIYLSMVFGLDRVMFHYGIPCFVLYAYFAIITFLHHTDTFVPHYRGSEWSWIRGSLCTVDRSYGRILDHVTHQITTTHVVHHLFPSIPFYYAQEASKCMSKVIGKYHLKDDTPVLRALWRAVCNCHFVEDGGMVVFWKKNFHQ